MNKIVIITGLILIILAVPMGAATSSNIKFDKTNLTVPKGETVNTTGHVNLSGSGYSSMSISTESSPNGVDLYYSQTSFDSDTDFRTIFSVGDNANTGTSSAVVNMSWKNTTGNTTYDYTTEKFILNIITPLQTVWQGELKTGDILKISPSINISIDGVSGSTASIKLENGGTNLINVNEGKSHTFHLGDTRIKVIVPNVINFQETTGASIKIRSNQDFSPSLVSETKKVKSCVLGLQSIGQLRRGWQFSGKTICTKNGKRVGRVDVLVQNPRKGGKVIGHLQSDPTGYFSINKIPETVKGPIVFKMSPLDNTEYSYKRTVESSWVFKPKTKKLSFGQSYNSYIKDKPEYKLVVDAPSKVLISKNVTGHIRNKVGNNITKAKVELIDPEGTRNMVQVKNSEFHFSPEMEGTYKLTATKPKYRDSKTVKLKVKKRNIRLDFDVLQKNKNKKNKNNKITPGEGIKVRIKNEKTEERVKKNLTVELRIGGRVKNYTVTNGIIPSGVKGMHKEWMYLVNPDTCSNPNDPSTCEPLDPGTNVGLKVYGRGAIKPERTSIPISKVKSVGITGMLTGSPLTLVASIIILIGIIIGLRRADLSSLRKKRKGKRKMRRKKVTGEGEEEKERERVGIGGKKEGALEESNVQLSDVREE